MKYKYRNLKHVEICGIPPFGELETDDEIPLCRGVIERVTMHKKKKQEADTE